MEIGLLSVVFSERGRDGKPTVTEFSIFPSRAPLIHPANWLLSALVK
jgi:hypothetical protein